MSREAPALVFGPAIQRWILPGLLAVALVTRLAAALAASGDAFRFVDEAMYVDAAERLLVAGVLLGVFTLFRPLGLALAPVLTGWVGLAPGCRWSRRAAYVAVLLGAWALVLVPWAHRNYQAYGRLLPNTVGLRGVPVIGAEVGRRGVAGAVAILTSAPSLRRSARDALSAVSFGFELVLAGIGVAAGWRNWCRETVWLLGLVLSFALGYSIFYGKLCYRIPSLPVVLGFAWLGVASLGGLLNRSRSPDLRGRSQWWPIPLASPAESRFRPAESLAWNSRMMAYIGPLTGLAMAWTAGFTDPHRAFRRTSHRLHRGTPDPQCHEIVVALEATTSCFG